MKAIVVGFSKPKKFNIISNLIMKIQGTNYSHVYLSFKTKSLDRTLIYQANKHGVWFIGKTKFSELNDIVDYFLIPLSDDQHKTALQNCVDLAGSEYGFFAIVGIGIEKLLLRLKIRSKNALIQKNRYICSKLVAYILEAVDINISESLDEVTPQDLHSLLQELNSSVKVIRKTPDK